MNKKFRRLMTSSLAVAICALSVSALPASAGKEQDKGKTSDGYDWEMWNQNGTGNTTMELGTGGAFSCSWNGIQNCLFRTGRKLTDKKNYKTYGTITIDYDVDYTPNGNSYMCVYGWTEDPTVEYYIVEAWGDWRPPGEQGGGLATLNLDGKTYNVYKSTRVNMPSIHGTETFDQYWSVNTTNPAKAYAQTNLKGTITVSDHFEAWEKAGLNMKGTLWEVSLNIEGYQSNGEAKVNKNALVTNGEPSTNDTSNTSTTGNDNNTNTNPNTGNTGWQMPGDWNTGWQMPGDWNTGWQMPGDWNTGWQMPGNNDTPTQPATQPATQPPAPASSIIIGDVNGDGKVNTFDVIAARALLLKTMGGGQSPDEADANGNGSFEVADIVTLQEFVFGKIKKFPERTVQQNQQNNNNNNNNNSNENNNNNNNNNENNNNNNNNNNSSTGSISSAKEYMAMAKANFTSSVPGDIKGASNDGTLKKGIKYFSKKANREKPCNIWLPPNYSTSEKYPVLYMNHGVMGGENDMVSGWSICEMASALIKKGEVKPFIIVFTQMYTDPKSGSAMGITQDSMDRYDDFVYDLTESLMPYMAENYSVAEGRENTAIAGFSMCGRESLYCGLMVPDKIGYICASSPAPGIVACQDSFLNHRGSYNLSGQVMKESDFKFSSGNEPYLLMIGGGTNDMVVGTFPKQYHEIFDKNGTDNIWFEVAGAGHDASVGTPLFYNFMKNLFKA